MPALEVFRQMVEARAVPDSLAEYVAEAIQALELMRAAAPKDPEAETRHCFQAAERMTGYEWTAIRVAADIERERALARAEGVSAGTVATLDRAYRLLVHNASSDMVHPARSLSADGQQYCDRLGEALRAEILGSDPQYETRLDELRDELETKLAADREQWRHDRDAHFAEFKAQLETQLRGRAGRD